MTQTQSDSDIGEAVQQRETAPQAGSNGLDWLLGIFLVTPEQQRTGTHLSEYPVHVSRLQNAVKDAGYPAVIAEVKSSYGHPITHESGAVRKVHLVVVSGNLVLDPYCKTAMLRDQYLQKAYHESSPATLMH